MAGIALTDPAQSKSFAVMSAFDAQGQAPEEFASIAAVDTVVFLMGGSRLALLCERLIDAGARAFVPPWACVVCVSARASVHTCDCARMCSCVGERKGLGHPIFRSHSTARANMCVCIDSQVGHRTHRSP
jgi:hypothetical protein